MATSKEICNLKLTGSEHIIVIDNISFQIGKISTLALSKFKKKLVDAALKQI